MKKALVMILTGGLFAGLAVGDTWSNERFRVKTGRDLPSVEQARKVASDVAKERAGFVFDIKGMAPVHNEAEDRFFTKYGRHTPLEEARLEALRPAIAPEYRGTRTEAEERVLRKTGR